MAIPLKSLRYQSGRGRVWGINIRRVIRRKNEWTHPTRVPASAGVPGGMFRLLKVGDNFNPEVGFVRRDNFARTFSSLRFSPRPKTRFKSVRQFTYQGTVECIENGAARV